MAYTPPTREQIYQALWALTAEMKWDVVVSPASFNTWVSSDRRVKLFADVPTPQQPFICQAEHGEAIAQKSNLPYRRVFEASWIIYQASGLNKSTAGAILNNKILDAVQAAMVPKPTDVGFPQRNTLGGLVYHCYIDGIIFKDPGDIDDQAMMVVPVKMLVP